MNSWRFATPLVLLATLSPCPAFPSARVYTITAAGEQLQFVAQPEKGYVVKLTEKAGAIHALAGIPALNAEGTRPVAGAERRGVWTVENEGPAGHNEDTIRALRATGQVRYAAPLFSSNGETVAILPEIVVRVRPGVEARQVHFLCQSLGLPVIKPMEFTTQEYLLEVLGPDAEAVFAAMEQLGQAPEVEWACPNTALRPQRPAPVMPANDSPGGEPRIAAAGEVTVRTGVFPNDEYFPMQWHLHNTGQSGGTPGADIRAPEAWQITTGDPNIVIAVIDTGVDSNHPDLVDNLVAGYDFYEDDDHADPSLKAWLDAHGTCCAGLVAAEGNNSIGVTGVAYDSKIMPIRDGKGNSFITIAEEATAFRWAAAHGADVISWSAIMSNIPVLHSAVQDVTRLGGIGREGKGCTVVFAAGNWKRPIRSVETAAYPEVIAVGATDHNDQCCWYSDYGPELDIAAPSSGGVVVFPNLMEGRYFEEYLRLSKHLLWTTDILGHAGWSTFNENPILLDYTEKMLGTSGATPIAAGVAALILSIEPSLTNDEVRHFLERSAKDLGDPGRDDYYGWGRVDARAALDMVLAKRADLNNDWKVDEEDRAVLMKAMDANDLSADIAPAAKRDGGVDANDLALLTRYLGTVIPELGLIAHWKLDETEGTVAHDAAGDPAYNATVMGLALWQPDGGKVGGALQLSGAPNLIMTKLSHDPSTGPFSVSAWVKGGGPGQVILSQTGGANWLMAGDPGGVLTTDLKDPGRKGKSLASQTVVTDGAWHRVGFVWDGSNRILYVDGVEVARDTQANLAGSAGNLSIGAGSTMAPSSFWSGVIDDVRIYDRAVKP